MTELTPETKQEIADVVIANVKPITERVAQLTADKIYEGIVQKLREDNIDLALKDVEEGRVTMEENNANNQENKTGISGPPGSDNSTGEAGTGNTSSLQQNQS